MQGVVRVEHQAGIPAPPIELSDATLNDLMAALDGAGEGPSGRRGDSRLRVQGTAVMIPLDPSSGSAARDVGVYDISRSGIAIVHDQQMAPGERFKLHVPRPGGQPVEMICSVRHCRPLEGQFVIGAQFGGDFSRSTRPDGVSPIAAALRAKGAGARGLTFAALFIIWRFQMIRKLSSGKYRLYSQKKSVGGKRKNLGTFSSRAAAEKHEREVQFFKRH